MVGMGRMRPFHRSLLAVAALGAGDALAQLPGLGPVDSHWETRQLTPHFWAEGACAADVDHDGKVDVLCGPYWYAGPDFARRHTIYRDAATFLKDGETIPGFKGVLSGTNGYSDNFIAHATDLNRDGWLDYLVAGYPGKETVWYENPRGGKGPWPRHLILAATDNESPAFVDMDGDGRVDLLCMHGQTVGYAVADPKDPYAPWTWRAVSAPDKRFDTNTHGLGRGDLNSDGRMDILERAGWWEQPVAWDGKTPWVFHAMDFGIGGAQMHAVDVNGDRRTDVITAIEAHGYGLAWFEQTANGWTKHLITGDAQQDSESGVLFTQIHAIDLADLNADGLPDIVTGKRVWAHGPTGDVAPGAPAVLYWFELKRDGGKASFLPHLIHRDSGVGTQVLATDLNGDGRPDIVAANKRGCFISLQR